MDTIFRIEATLNLESILKLTFLSDVEVYEIFEHFNEDSLYKVTLKYLLSEGNLTLLGVDDYIAIPSQSFFTVNGRIADESEF